MPPLRWEPAKFETINGMLWRPVAAGLWRQHETFDGTYDVQDLFEVLEYLDVRAENQRREAAAARERS